MYRGIGIVYRGIKGDFLLVHSHNIGEATNYEATNP